MIYSAIYGGRKLIHEVGIGPASLVTDRDGGYEASSLTKAFSTFFRIVFRV